MATDNNNSTDDTKLKPIDAPRINLSIPVRCGNCWHFTRSRASVFSDICSRLGILPNARPCQHFVVDAKSFSLTTAEGGTFAQFVGQMSKTKLAGYAALLVQEIRTRRSGLKHGEVVFVHLYPGDYISNYAKAWVIQADRRTVHIQGKATSFRGMVMRSSVLTVKEFATKRASLKARRRIIDPNLPSYVRQRIRPGEALATMEQPTIDEVTANKKFPGEQLKGRRITRKDNLVRIVMRDKEETV